MLNIIELERLFYLEKKNDFVENGKINMSWLCIPFWS